MPYEVIYTDGCCLNNGCDNAQAGVGVFFGAGDRRNVSTPLPGTVQTNNRAELMAIILAVRHGKDGHNLWIKSDSDYVVKAMNEWIFDWEVNDWRLSSGKKVKNLDLFQSLYKYTRNHNGLVRFEHVRGHSGEPGNEEAHNLANIGARK